jgi:hypothetical protein
LRLVIGIIAGKVIEKEDRLQTRRTKELDAIIGVTEGSLGAVPIGLCDRGSRQGLEGSPQVLLIAPTKEARKSLGRPGA